MKTATDYWFTIEPYIYVNIINKYALLYNTLDGSIVESSENEIIMLLKETLQKENCGVTLLTNERYGQEEVKSFISELRDKYMGDIIDVTLSKSKPVQLLPFFNLSDKPELYKKHNFSQYKNALEYLSEISICVDHDTNITELIHFLQSAPENLTFNVVKCVGDVTNYGKLLSFLDQLPSPKNMLCSYKNVVSLQPVFNNNFSYRISVFFPIELEQWEHTRRVLLNQTLPVEYIFEVTSDKDILQAEQMVEQYQIEKYQLKPVYTGKNIQFFEENVFLTKEDILAAPITIKDFFARQAMNIYDFGKINIMPNGDVYANLNHSALGNIYTNNIYEIVYKEVEEGKSWFRIRNQAPCNNCVYQWLCPPPSNYEIAIGRPNLCHVKQ